MIFKDMLLHDVHLRLNGTYTMLKFTDGHDEAVFIRDVGAQRSRGYDTGTTVSSVLVSTAEGNKEYSGESLQDVEFRAPAPGYVIVGGTLRYVSQLPERQTKAGAPPHAVRLLRDTGKSFRLADFDLPDALRIVDQLYRPVYTKPVWDGTGQPYYVIGKGLAVDTSKRVLYGPEFFTLGSYTVNDGMVSVTTKHPVTLRTYLLSAGVLK